MVYSLTLFDSEVRRFDNHASENVPSYYKTFQEKDEQIEEDLKPMSSDINKRLAFVHYVYPSTSQKSSHFKQFEENQ